MQNRVAFGNTHIVARARDHRRGDAPDKIGLAIFPIIIRLAVDQAGDDPFARRVDDARVGGNLNLCCATNCRDAIALDDDDGIRERCAAKAIDQRTALNHQRALALRRW